MYNWIPAELQPFVGWNLKQETNTRELKTPQTTAQSPPAMLWNENDISMVMKEVDLNGESEGGVLQSYYFISVAIERSVTSSPPLLLRPSCFTKHTLTLFAVHSRIFPHHIWAPQVCPSWTGCRGRSWPGVSVWSQGPTCAQCKCILITGRSSTKEHLLLLTLHQNNA